MSRITTELLSSIIGDIYDCAINPTGWSATLSRITLALDAAYTTISLTNPIERQGRMAAHSPWDPEQLRILNEDFGLDGIPGLKDVFMGEVDVTWSTLANIPEPEFQQTAFYQQWAKPQGLRDACLVKFVNTPDRIGIMGCITRASRDMITAEEQIFVTMLSPHLRRSALIGDLLEQARIEAKFYQSTLNSLSVSVILTDENGRIHFANAVAETMLADAMPIQRSGGRLKCRSAVAQASLAAALKLAFKSDQSIGGSGIGIPLSLAGEPAAVAYVLPLSLGTARAAFDPAKVAVFISTKVAATPPPEAVLMALFDLTVTEARVAHAIVRGIAKQSILASLKISENTLKTHMSRIYRKTGTNSQNELLKLAAGIGAPG